MSVALSTCSARNSPSSDGGRDVAADGGTDAAGAVDAEAEAARDDGGSGGDATGSGPVTLVGVELGVTDERFFDLDGDGLEDNFVADYGSELASIVIMMLNTLLAGEGPTEKRFVTHVPADRHPKRGFRRIFVVAEGCGEREIGVRATRARSGCGKSWCSSGEVRFVGKIERGWALQHCLDLEHLAEGHGSAAERESGGSERSSSSS
jgi:hypothetical protein